MAPPRMRGAVLLAAVALWGQESDRIAERIRGAPLAEERRAALTASYSKRDFAGVEAILAGRREAELSALLGAIEFVGGRMSQAVQAFRRADAVKPLDDPDRFTLAMALVSLGDVRGARPELTRLNAGHPDQPIYLYWLARLDYGQRLYEDAVTKLKRVIELDPESVRGYDNLGLAYDMMGLGEEARKAFDVAVTLNRKAAAPSPWPPHNLGALLLRLQKFHEAEDSLRESLKYDPRFAEAHYHLGRALEGQGRNEEAIGEYKLASEMDTKVPEPVYSLALLYRKLGRSDEAAKALAEYKRRKALAVDSL